MRLTPVTYLLAGLIALLGIIEQWRAALPFPVWRLAAGVLVAALLYEWLRVRGIRLTVCLTCREPLALGRRDVLPLGFVNRSRAPLALLFAPALPAAFDYQPAPRRLDLDPGSAVSVPVPARPLELGGHLWTEVPVRLRGPLGLGWWGRRCRLDQTLTVAPDLLRAPAAVDASAGQGASRRHAMGRGSELHHLRAYRPGDPRHLIDWKATARAGSLVTRVFTDDQHLEIVLILDVGRTAATEVGALSQLGHYVNAAARFAEHATALDDRVGLVAVADRLYARVPPQRGLEAVTRVRRALAGLTIHPVETDLLQGVLAVQRLVRHRALVVVLTDLYGQGTGGRLSECVRLLRPRHLPLVVSLVGEELETLAHRPAGGWLDPYTSLAAREYRSRVERNAAALRRHGCHALVTTPANLDDRVVSLYRILRSQRRI